MTMTKRFECLEALYNNQPFDANGSPESVHNIASRYDDIESNFPETLKIDALPYYIDWLKENVDLVEITTYSDEEAYTIFETMNDRGLSLTPADMLKGYLLANIRMATSARAPAAHGRSAFRRSANLVRTRMPTASSRGFAANTPQASANAKRAPCRRTLT